MDSFSTSERRSIGDSELQLSQMSNSGEILFGCETGKKILKRLHGRSGTHLRICLHVLLSHPICSCLLICKLGLMAFPSFILALTGFT